MHYHFISSRDMWCAGAVALGEVVQLAYIFYIELFYIMICVFGPPQLFILCKYMAHGLNISCSTKHLTC